MQVVKGTFQNGVAHPTEPVEGRDGPPVIITFLDERDVAKPPSSVDETSWDELIRLLKDCAMNTGIADLAHQHDHYLYGMPK